MDWISLEKFLNFITSGYDSKVFWEIRIFRKGEVYFQEFFERKEDIVSFFKKKVEDLKDKDCYIGLLPRVEKIGDRSAIKFGNTFVIDLDREKAIEDFEKIYQKLFSLNFPPSLIVNSGNGLHIYYKIKKVIDVEKWRILQQALINFFLKNFSEYNVDKVVKDETRIIRIAGTINNKKEPKIAKILKETEFFYDFEYFEDFLKNFVELKDVKVEREKSRSSKLGRFEVMALLQAARYYLLKGDLERAKSFGLNRAIFYAWAKYYGPNYPPKSKRFFIKELGETFEVSAEKDKEWEIVGNEKAPVDKRFGFFVMGDKPQLPKDFDVNIARKFERIDNFEKIWDFAIEYLKRFDRKDLEDQRRFFKNVYKPIRDNFEEFYKKNLSKKSNIFDYFKS